MIGNGVTLTDNTGTGFVRYSEAMGNSNVTFSYVAARDGFCCIRLDLPKRNDYYVSVNGTELYKESISLPQMTAVGDVKTGDLIEVRVVCKSGESSTMDVKAAILNPDMFRRGYNILNVSTWKLTEFDNTRLEGIIHCDRDGLMYTSIPQNGNWKVTVDGEEVETVLVGDCMAAVKLNQGSHLVNFTYENPAFSLGWKISVVCMAVFAALIWLGQGRPLPGKQNKRGRFEK